MISKIRSENRMFKTLSSISSVVYMYNELQMHLQDGRLFLVLHRIRAELRLHGDGLIAPEQVLKPSLGAQIDVEMRAYMSTVAECCNCWRVLTRSSTDSLDATPLQRKQKRSNTRSHVHRLHRNK